MERYDEGAYHCSRTGHANFRPALDPPRGLPLKPSSFSQLIKNFVSPDEPTSVTGGGTLCGSGMSAPKRPIRWRPHERPSVSAVNPSNRPVGTGQSTSVAIQGNLGVDQLGNRTAGFGLASQLLEFCLVGARDLCFQRQMDGGDGKAVGHFFERDLGSGLHVLGSKLGLAENEGQSHREAPCVGGADELF